MDNPKGNYLNKNNNSAEAKGIRTFLQSVGATVVAYLYGLWQLPGVSEYTNNFIHDQGFGLLVGLAALVGIPAGLFAYFQNKKK